MSLKNEEKKGVFINGKQQVIELLKKMDAADKTKLLRNLKVRNPALAKELTESCLSFENIWDLHDHDLKSIVTQIRPAILGLALNLVHVKNQRRSLALLSREMAMKAFEVMQSDLTTNRNECLKAQQKVLELALSLQRNKVIQFY